MPEAVIYLGPPSTAGKLRETRPAACEDYARRTGLTVLGTVEGPGTLATRPGTAVILEPDALPRGAAGWQLWSWLERDVVIDRCDGGLARTGILGLESRLLVFGIGMPPDAHERARRWAECRAYAQRLGFAEATLNTAENLDALRSRPRAAVVILHPDYPELRDRAGAPLADWLSAGVAVHIVAPLPQQPPLRAGLDTPTDRSTVRPRDPGAPPPPPTYGVPQQPSSGTDRAPRDGTPPPIAQGVPSAAGLPPTVVRPEEWAPLLSGQASSAAPAQAPTHRSTPHEDVDPLTSPEDTHPTVPLGDIVYEARVGDGSSTWQASRDLAVNTIQAGTFDAPVIQVGNIYGEVNIGGGAPGRQARDAARPLPRDGLFIRRNNAFGTRSTAGITELIENGVMVDQEQIRFDDFLATRADEIPGPAARSGEAVAVSHGWAPAPPGAPARAATTHFVELAIKAADAPSIDLSATGRLPVNFVFVVDTSGSMEGAKLEAVRAALREVHRRLSDDDHLGIVTFDTAVRTVLRAVRKRDLAAAEFEAVIAGLRAGGATDLNLGLQYGIDEIGRNSRRSGRTVDCLYLFSDGDPTSGLCDWLTIRRNLADRLRGGITLSCFGFGSDARMRELGALAGIAGGHSTFVTQPEDVHAQLHSDLNRRDRLAAVDVQLKIELAPGVDLWHVYGHDLITDPAARRAVETSAAGAARRAATDYGTTPLPDLITDEDGIRIFSPDLAFGETYWVVLEVALPADSPTAIGTATVQYVDAPARANRSHRLDLAAQPAIAAETVAVHAIGLRTSEVTFDALDDLYENDRPRATARLRRHIALLEEADTLVPEGAFADDRVVLGKLVTLSGNLGLMAATADAGYGGPGPSGTASYSIMMMNRFGRVRSGYNPITLV